jgi:lipoprotein signal peptidase
MPLQQSKSKRLKYFFTVFSGVLFLDQSLKYIFVRSGLFQKNYAALFGLEINPLISFGALLLFLAYASHPLKLRQDAARFAVPFALILSGIISNAIDKIHTGFIIDYINLSNIYIFNLADLALFLGAILFIWRIIKE